MDEEGKALIEAKCCIACRHCFYSGLPGAYACDFKEFTDDFETCEKWELSGDFGNENVG